MILSGSLQSVSLWKDNEHFHTAKCRHEFHQSIEAEGLEPDMHMDLEVFVRDCRLTFLNERQMELACNLMVIGDGYSEKELVLLEEPAFVEGRPQHSSAMVITSSASGESLWDLAKRHRTTCQRIQQVNRLDGEPAAGQKLLILK
jgi:hypothetical protein